MGLSLNKGEFQCVTSNRSGTKAGGLALIYKSGFGIKCAMMDNGEKSSFQFAVLKLEIQNKVLTMVGICHPRTKYHVNDSNAVFIMEFFNFMCNLQLESKNSYLGDFNYM